MLQSRSGRADDDRRAPRNLESDTGPASMLFTEGELACRLMRDDDYDVGLMARWLSDARVLEFYEGRDNAFDPARVREKFGPRARGEDRVTSVILEAEEVPVGYLQYYSLSEHERQEYGVAAGIRAFGMDMFIGEVDRWGQGIGSRTVRGLLRYLAQRHNAELLVADPLTTNVMAIRAYEKGGLHKARLLPAHELHEGIRRDAWLMAVEP